MRRAEQALRTGALEEGDRLPTAAQVAAATEVAPESAVATAWKMTAYDRAGSSAAASVTGTPVILQESGREVRHLAAEVLGGRSYASGTQNASLTWTFTGRSVAWVVPRASVSGQAYVCPDGTKVATVDLKSTRWYRQAIWTKSWSSAARHTVRIVVVGTKERPALTTDGPVHLK